MAGKLHCLLLTKNEEDVIEHCLHEAQTWADYIYVYDGQSTDHTWDIVRSMASECIIPWKQDGKVFREGLRAEIFNHFHSNASEGDWWLQLNADEFYRSNPKDFLNSLPQADCFVWGITVEYKLTHRDIAELDFTLPFDVLRPQLRYYRVDHAEPRAFRHRKRLRWDDDCAWPHHVGLTARRRLYYYHYPYRSPQQLQNRLDVRRENRSRGFEGWAHASQEDWQDKIEDAAACQYDNGESEPSVHEDALPWHLEPLCLRIAKRVLHGLAIWP